MNLGEFSCLGPATWLSVNGDIAVRTTTAEDWAYIDSLQKADANAVGFLQRRTWDDYVWGGQRNFMTFLCLVQNVPVGYVLLTPGRGVNHPARIQQIVIQQDVRRLEYGTALVDQCVRFCEQYERSGIALRCRADLSANWFWGALGFTLLRVFTKGSVNHVNFKASNDILQYFRPTKATLFEEAPAPLIYIPGQYDPKVVEYGNLSSLFEEDV